MRTNNISEDWNNHTQVVVGQHHPSLYAFFKEIQKKQGDTEMLLRQLSLGQKMKKENLVIKFLKPEYSTSFPNVKISLTIMAYLVI